MDGKSPLYGLQVIRARFVRRFPTRKYGGRSVIALVTLAAGFLQVGPPTAQGSPQTPSRAESSAPGDTAGVGTLGYTSHDGSLDLSDFIDEPYGFLPIAAPITEPAVGYGLYGGPVFIGEASHRSEAGFGRPNVTFAGGAWTENGTWGAFGADVRHWMGDQLSTLAALAHASVNLDFYGVGEDAVLNKHPVRYTITTSAGGAQARYRLGRSCFWAGLGYVLAFSRVEVKIPEEVTLLPDLARDSRQGGILTSLFYDSRNNIFTPREGSFLELTGGFFDESFGGDANFQRATFVGMQYLSLHPRLTLAIRGDGVASFGHCPFFLLPAIMLRGVPMMRYQGKQVASFEAEVRWQCWTRWSLIGFGGTGWAWNNLEHVDNRVHVLSGGLGFRYDIAARYGLHCGVDVGFSPDCTAVYLVFGSAWNRP